MSTVNNSKFMPNPSLIQTSEAFDMDRKPWHENHKEARRFNQENRKTWQVSEGRKTGKDRYRRYVADAIFEILLWNFSPQNLHYPKIM